MNIRNKSLEYDIIILLRDYNNFLPSGSGDCFVPMSDGTHFGSSEPSTEEASKRFDKNNLVGETYNHLDKALLLLDKEYPLLYEAINVCYLQDEVGHRDVEHWRGINSLPYKRLVKRHDEAITRLSNYLLDADLYVRRPSSSVIPKTSDLGDINEALFQTYLRFRNQNINHRQAINDTLVHFPDYTRKRASTIISEKLSEQVREFHKT